MSDVGQFQFSPTPEPEPRESVSAWDELMPVDDSLPATSSFLEPGQMAFLFEEYVCTSPAHSDCY